MTSSPSSLSFTAIDFEIANPNRGSVCAVGAVKVRAGSIVEEYVTTVRPPAGLEEFSEINRRVHGIGPSDVANSPNWQAVHAILAKLIGNDVIVAHNAEFEVSVLNGACLSCGIQPRSYRAYCTKKLAKAFLQLPSYKLPDVVRHLGLPRFQHHEPLADARAAAQAMLRIAEQEDISSLDSTILRNVAAVGASTLPDYIFPQSLAAQSSNYNVWLRTCLANPRGRATGGERCVMCDAVVDQSLHWQLREQHVCSNRCGGKLKNAAKKLWQAHGIAFRPDVRE